jgi:hypothetical protein
VNVLKVEDNRVHQGNAPDFRLRTGRPQCSDVPSRIATTFRRYPAGRKERGHVEMIPVYAAILRVRLLVYFWLADAHAATMEKCAASKPGEGFFPLNRRYGNTAFKAFASLTPALAT